jgi:hypothetical protein
MFGVVLTLLNLIVSDVYYYKELTVIPNSYWNSLVAKGN